MKPFFTLHDRRKLSVIITTVILLIGLINDSPLKAQCAGFSVEIEGPQYANYCAGDLLTLTAVVTGGTSPFTYSWSTGGNQAVEQVIAVGFNFVAFVTVTDANGCTVSDGFQIKGFDELDISIEVIGGPNCTPGYSVLLNVDGASPYSDYMWSNGEIGETIIIYTSGTYSVTVSTIPGGCTAETSVDINFLPSPDVEIVGDNLICPQGSTSLSVNGGSFVSYNWAPTGGTSPELTVYDPGLYTVTVTNSNGCTGVYEYEVFGYIMADPVLSAPPILCPEEEGTIALVNASDYASFSWNTGETTSSILAMPGEDYNVSVFAPNGCVLNGSVSINPFPVLVPEITGAGGFCEGQDSLVLTADSSYVSYVWSTMDSVQSVTVAGTGIYTVTATDVNGCTTVGVDTVTALLPPEPFIPAASACAGNAAELEVEGGPFTSYLWSNGSSDSTISVTQPGIYGVTVSGANGCTADTMVTVNFTQGLSANISSLPYDCSGVVTLAGSGGVDYVWSNGETGPSISVQNSGTYMVTVTDVSGCTGIAETEVAVPGLPQVSIAGTLTLCAGGSAELEASGGFSQYLWSGGETTPILTVSQTGVYTVTVTDANGCTATAEQAVAISPSPEPELMGPAGICENGTATLGLTQPFSQMVWSNGENAQSITVLQPSTYIVTVTDAAGCTGTGELDIIDYPSPLVDIIGPSSICNGGEAILYVSDNFSQIIWNTGETTNNINVSEADLYSVVVIDANGCTNEAFLEVETGSSLSPSVLSLGNACDGVVTLEAGAGYDDYIWSNGETEPTITVFADGDYSITVSDVFGCSGVETVTVSIPAPPQVGISGPAAICEGESAVLTADSGFVSYLWSNGGTTPTTNISQTGQYSVTATDANGCTVVANQTLSNFPTPTVDISGPSSACLGSTSVLSIVGNFSQVTWSIGETTDSIIVSQPGSYSVMVTDVNGCTVEATHELEISDSLSPVIATTDISCNGTATLNAGAGYGNYFWSNGETGQDITVDVSGTYFVTVSDGMGCTGEASLSVDLLVPFSVDISGLFAICMGASTEFSVPDYFTEVIWSNGETTSAITVSDGGDYGVTVTDANGCTATDFQTLEMNSSLIVDIEVFQVGCNGTATLDAGSGYVSYLWSDGSTSPVLTVSNSDLYGVTVSDANGCTGSNAIDVDLTVAPIVGIVGSPTVCEGGETVLAIPDFFVQYLWSTGDTLPVTTVTQGGIYKVTVTDDIGCTATGEWLVTQLPTDYSFMQIEACSAQDTGLVETVFTNQFGCDSIVIVQTILAPELFSTVELAACVGTFVEFDGTPIAAGDNQQFIYNASSGCDSVVSVSVALLPPVSFILSTNSPCWGTDDGSVEVAVQTGSTPYEYALNGGATQPSPVFTGLGEGQYSILVTDANGCELEQNIGIVQIEPLQVLVEDVELPCGEGPVTLRPLVLSGNTTSIGWEWGNGSSSPYLLVDVPGDYLLHVDDGCDEQEFMIHVVLTSGATEGDLFYIPNSFSPNQDGFNDEFKAYPGQDFTLLSFELKVFDRWGDMLFGTADVATGWDGIFQGRQMQPGVYGWYVKARVELCGGQVTDFYQEGGVTIIR